MMIVSLASSTSSIVKFPDQKISSTTVKNLYNTPAEQIVEMIMFMMEKRGLNNT